MDTQINHPKLDHFGVEMGIKLQIKRYFLMVEIEIYSSGTW
jgi:hypothetical protein